MKDIFIDNNIAKNFCNPVDQNYKKLIAWLIKDGSLVISKKILSEYYKTAEGNSSSKNVIAIIDIQTREGRLNRITNHQIKTFPMKKRIKSNLRSNAKDHPHLISVLLSDRKMALTIDRNLIYDLNNYAGYTCIVSKKPENINYK